MTSQLHYPYAEHPVPGTTVEVADGVRWLTMPMPGSLNHINLYLLEDKDGWWVVDTGLGNAETREWWLQLYRGDLGGRPVKAVICTHMHPDHIGQARAITDDFECPLHMTRTEYYQARAFSASRRQPPLLLARQAVLRARRNVAGLPRATDRNVGPARRRFDVDAPDALRLSAP